MGVIENKQIVIEEKPFRHVVIDNFFKKDFYDALCAAFKKVLLGGLSETRRLDIFSRFDRYDAYSYSINPKSGYPLNFFYTKEWHDYIAGIFGVSASRDVTGGFHHHLVNSEDGFIHEDFNLVSFVEDRLENGINPFYNQCVYTDDSPDKQPHTFKRMRAVALIYYLLDDPNWKDGDGGETGLYGSRDKNSLISKVAPINNRLFAFEISPYSFHGFLKNKKSRRNSIIQWLHQEPEIMLKRYVGHKPSPWKK